jgi:hypothetical protein
MAGRVRGWLMRARFTAAGVLWRLLPLFWMEAAENDREHGIRVVK